ncbi:histidine kinase [Chitinophaga sp. SYP-B3965]|nr:histidine kinase [Chitinophaga sp. SYP-B3965]
MKYAFMRMRLFFLLLMMLCGIFKVSSQQYTFRHYQVEDGLSHNTVWCAYQDSKGFMWFGTKDGLNRFDGTSFKIFRNNAEDTNSIGNNFIRCLLEDNKKRLWIGTDNGIYLYQPETEAFHLLPASRIAAVVWSIRSDSKGNIWFLMGEQIYQYNEQLNRAIPVFKNSQDIVTSLCIDSEDQLWYTANDQLKRYDPRKGTLTAFNIFSHSHPTEIKFINTILDCRNGKLLLGTTTQGIKIFDIATATYKDALLSNTDKTPVYVRDFVQINANEYWVAAESGIYVYDLNKDTYTNLKKDYNNLYSLSDNSIYTLCKDKEGGLWAGTFFGGINYFPKQYAPFHKYFPNNNPRTLSGNAVREICQDKYGNLWIGTEDNGLNKLNPATGDISHYLPGGNPGDISHSNVHGLMAKGNELWIGLFHHGIDVMNISTGKVIKRYTKANCNLNYNFILSIIQTQSGEILIGSQADLKQYDTVTKNFTNVEQVLENYNIHSVMQSRDGTVWIATHGQGLLYYNKAAASRGRYRYDPLNRSGIGSDMVNSAFEDSRGIIWVATEGGGICRLDRKQNKFIRYTTKTGWPSDYIFKILEDEQHKLWVSTSRGLVCFDPEKETLQLFTQAHGLLNDQFNYNSGYKDREGNMYFGSVKGMISFNPRSFIQDTFTPPLYITDFQISSKETPNKLRQPRSMMITPEIKLAHNEASFSIDFAALSYTAPTMTQYAYSMKGLDNNWINTKSNKAYFTDLSPGTYTFAVKAAGNNGKWGEPVAITIRISPPFWASIWAYLFYTLTIAAIAYYIARFYYKRIQEKKRIRLLQIEHERNIEIYQAKMNFLTNIAHEIRSPLTLIKGPLEKVIKQAVHIPAIAKNLARMEKSTNRLVKLTNQLLDFRKTEAKGFSLTFRKVDVSKLLEDIFFSFKPLAEQKHISFSLLPLPFLHAYVDEEALNKILSNLFSNAIKYSHHSVKIRLLQPDTEYFIIEFSNDGYIIPTNKKEKIFEPFFRLSENQHQEGTGIGLPLSRSLAELHGGMLYISEEITSKNVFILKIPLIISIDNLISSHEI